MGRDDATDPNALAERWMPLAFKIARRLARPVPHLADELESAALIGLVEASRSFDPANAAGASFQTYATGRIVGACKDAMRDAVLKGYRRRPAEAPAVESLDLVRCASDSGREMSGHDLIPADTLPVGWEAESEDAVAGLLRGLPAGWSDILRDFYMRADRATQEAAGRAHGLSKSRVSRIRTQAMDYIRGKVMNGGNRIGGALIDVGAARNGFAGRDDEDEGGAPEERGPVEGARLTPPPGLEGTRLAIWEAAAALAAEGARLTDGLIGERAGVSNVTVCKHRNAMAADGLWPFPKLVPGDRRNPRPPKARAKSVRSEAGPNPEPQTTTVVPTPIPAATPPLHPDLAAINAAILALEPLGPAARRLALAYLGERLGGTD